VEHARILVAWADRDERVGICARLERDGLAPAQVASWAALSEQLGSCPPDGVLLDAGLQGCPPPGEASGLVVQRACPALVIALHPSRIAEAVDALRAGADRFLLAPVNPFLAALAMERALERRGLQQERSALLAGPQCREVLLGTATELSEAREVVRRIGPTRVPVLVTGESGTGKALLARLLHDGSPRRDCPLVEARCAGPSQQLLDHLLFGGEGPLGATGHLGEAASGTLLLRDVDRLPAPLQAKLLRALDGELAPGSPAARRPPDTRVVATTRLDLSAEVATGRFRRDLFYRLGVVTVQLPPLRGHREDLGLLARHFLADAARAQCTRPLSLAPLAAACLLAHDWPGNVRELRQALEQAAVRCRGPRVELDDLSPALRGALRCEEDPSLVPGATLKRIEREAIVRTLQIVGGSTARAAQILGISVRKIQYRLEAYRSEGGVTLLGAGEVDSRQPPRPASVSPAARRA